jgi:glucokinase
MASRPGARLHLGLDLGGTNIKWVVVEQANGEWRALDRDLVATPADGGPPAVVAGLADVGAAAVARWPGVASVGIGVPGLYDPRTGATRWLVNLPGDWAGVPMAERVGQALGVPARLINDARAFGLAELRMGAGRGASTMVGFTLGTGVGGVVIVDGRLHQGHDGTAGELGHQTIEPDGPWCGCGNRGCLEAFVRADQIAAECGADTAEEAVRRARAGDERALDGIARAGRYLGIGIANLVVITTPERVVLGGGVSAAFDLLIDPIWSEVRRRVHVTSLESVEIVPAQLGTWAGAIGAAIWGAGEVSQ